MDGDQLAAKIISQCPQLVRPAWLPVKAEHCSGRLKVSKFGGCNPFRRKNFQWRRCNECSQPKSFLLQLELRTLPASARALCGMESGLFQVFYCLNCTPYDGCFDDMELIPESEMVPSLQTLASIKIVEAGLELETLPTKLRDVVVTATEKFLPYEHCPEHEVASWDLKGQEIPSLTEIGERIESTLEQAGITMETLEEAFEENGGRLAELQWHIPRVKLGGWVRWCQGVEYPQCPDCNQEMTVPFLQMETSDILSFMWGDCGTAHITLCSKCGKPGLGWACG